MTFQKKHKLGFTSEHPFDKDPICLRVQSGVKIKLKAIPDWQKRLRKLIDKLIEEVENCQ